MTKRELYFFYQTVRIETLQFLLIRKTVFREKNDDRKGGVEYIIL